MKKLASSSKQRQVKLFLKQYADGKYRAAAVEFSPDSGDYFVVIPSEIPITDHAKKMLRRRLSKALNLNAAIVTLLGLNSNLYCEGIRELLTGDSDFVDDVVVSHDGVYVTAVVFVNRNGELDYLQDDRKLFGKLKRYFNDQSLILERVLFSELSVAPPSDVQILSTLNKLSPAKLDDLITEFEAKNLPFPSLAWGQRRMDALRRNGFVIWQKSERYAITSLGISALPAAKGKKSNDVARALELGRRRW